MHKSLKSAQVFCAKLPFNHNKALCILSLYIIVKIDMILPKIAFTATPESIILLGLISPFFQANKNTNVQANNPPIKDATGKINENDGNTKSIIIAITLAPEETPVIPGSAKGFLITDCKSVPETDNPAPTKAAIKFLGNLIS